MKVIIELDFESMFRTEKRIESYMERYPKTIKSVLYDIESSAFYYEADIPFMPVEGQRLGTIWGGCIVTYACYCVGGDFSESIWDKTRIVVKEE